MNYYEHHLGDYAEATGHLSFVEDAAYSRMIRKYYATEKPLPVEKISVQRLVGARTKEERDAVSSILDEFFVLKDDGWHNNRCDSEIEKNHKKQAELKDLRERDEYRKHRDFVLNRDGHTCVYCGATDVALQLDHVIPRCRGGNDSPENLAACCKPCNTSKGAKTPEEWNKKQ